MTSERDERLIRTEALNIVDELSAIAEVYGTQCRDRVRVELAANPDLHWLDVVDLTLIEWERVYRPDVTQISV